MKTYFLIILLFLSSFYFIYAQLPPYYRKHYNYEYAINPAVTGRDYYPVVNLSHKKYWPGIKDSPSSTSLGAVMRLGSFNFYTPKMLLNKSNFHSKSRMGLGGFVMQENDGPLSYIHSTVNYAYFIPLNNKGDQLSFGISAQLFKYSVNEQMLNPLDPGDEKLLNLNDNQLIPEAGVGVYFHNEQFNIGASLNDLILSDISLFSEDNLENNRDLFMQVGYKFFLKHFEMEPSVLTAQIDGNPLYYSGQVKMYYLNYSWLAVSYKSTNMLSYAIGIRLNRFQMVYIFEHSVSSMINYFSSSHEIMLGMNIGLYEAQGLRKLAK